MSQSVLSFGSKLSTARTAVVNKRSRSSLAVRAQQNAEPQVSRREVSLAAAAALMVSLTSASPAKALFGSGDADAKYAAETDAILKSITSALELEVSDPTREEKLKDIKRTSIDWVARYRRDSRFSGRPSYGNTYTAVNALTGHLNSFGFTAAIPKKRLDRIQKEISDADKLLQRGR